MRVEDIALAAKPVGAEGGATLPAVVKLHVAPFAVMFAIVLLTTRQEEVVPGCSVVWVVDDSVTPSSTEPVSSNGCPGCAPLCAVLASATSNGGVGLVPK